MSDESGVQIDLAAIEPDSLPAWALWGAAIKLADRIDAMLPEIEARIHGEADEYRDVARRSRIQRGAVSERHSSSAICPGSSSASTSMPGSLAATRNTNRSRRDSSAPRVGVGPKISSSAVAWGSRP